MAETRARIGYGTLLQFGDGASPETFTTVAEVVDISGPSLSREIPDATHMESPDGYREFLGGLKDGGEITFTVNFLPDDGTQDSQTGLLSFFDSGVRKRWRIVWAGSPQVIWSMLAVIQDAQPAAPIDDKMTMDVTLKVSGKPEFL